MCFDIIDSVGKCFKAAIGCACFLVIGGPLLIILGVLFISKKDDFDGFKRAAKDFDPTPIESWNVKFNGVAGREQRGTLNVKGASGAESVFFEAAFHPPTQSEKDFTVQVSVNNAPPFSRSVPYVKGTIKPYECKLVRCKKSEFGCKCDKDLYDFRRKCTDVDKGVYTSFSSSCTEGSACGECRTTVYLHTMNFAAAEKSRGQYVENNHPGFGNCNFANYANEYKLYEPSNINVRLYSDKDPFVALQCFTEGRGYFLDMKSVAVPMIVVGAILTLLEICVCVGLVCYCMRKKGNSNTAAQPPAPNYSGFTSDKPPLPTQQDYAYGQPPPPTQQGYAYGQPPPPTQQGYAYGQSKPFNL